MPNEGGFDVFDIARERRAGPEERRTTGGLPYRVSRTNTPDLGQLRRELDRQRASAGNRQGVLCWPPRARQACVGDARTCVASVALMLLTTCDRTPTPPHSRAPASSSPHPPAPRQEPRSSSPNTAAIDGFAWIQEGLGLSLTGNRRLAPSNARPVHGGGARASAAAQHAGLTAPGRGRPQSARQPVPDRMLIKEEEARLAPSTSHRRPLTARPAPATHVFKDSSRASSSGRPTRGSAAQH
jgi:hypothetical protein